jgi:hypothetical protein
MATMGTVVVSLNGLEVIVALHTQVDPQPDEWAGYIDVHANLKKKHAGDPSRIRNLVVTDGGAPNAKQRASLNELGFGSSSKIVVITNALTNPLKRGVATAISWANPGFKALPPEQWREALRHVNLENQIHPILLELSRLQSKLPPVSSLALLVAAQS